MFILNGFCKISSLSDNSRGKISPIGELSPLSASYSRDKLFYRGKSKDTELIVFDATLDNVDVEPTVAYTDIITLVQQWVFEQSIGDRFTESSEATRAMIQSNFITSIRNVNVGSMTFLNGSWFPTWVSFIKEGSEENQITVWFSDSVFQFQYLGYFIIPVGPTTNIDVFQQTKQQVLDELKDFNMPDHNDLVQIESKGVPYTNLITREYTWHDREDSSSTHPTIWSVIIYGAAGNNAARRKKALQDYILANSNYPVADWVKVFPEIFTSTEFTFLPYWELNTDKNLTEEGSMYTPVVSYEKFMDKAEWFHTTVEAGDFEQNILFERNHSTIPIHYKSIVAHLVTGENNPVDKQVFTEIYEDYGIVPISSKQVYRVSPRTVEFTRMLITAIGYAEGLYSFNVIDHDYSIIEINGHKFYTFEHDNVEFRVYVHPRKQELPPLLS